jgi:hypothetical protein
MADGGKPLSGEHLNGLKYQPYSGPAEIQPSYLDQITTALETYAKESADVSLNNILSISRNKAWSRVGFEHLESDAKKSSSGKAKVGVRYRKGELQCVIYQNQVMAAFAIEEGEKRIEKLYYFADDKKLRVTHAYTF